MDMGLFIKKCKEIVRDYVNNELKGYRVVSTDDVYVVWSCKTLQNSKALLSARLPVGMYYELTYNGETSEIYFDAYKKVKNQAIPLLKVK